MNSLKLADHIALNQLQAEMLKFPVRDDIVTNHMFADGMYLREYIQPPDVLCVSKVHKKENFFIVTRGRAWISDGENPAIEVESGVIWITKPGTKRAVLTKSEGVTIVTVHRVNGERNMAKIERKLTVPDSTEAFDFNNKPKPGFLIEQPVPQLEEKCA